MIPSRLFEIAPFDVRCAIELAFLNRGVFASGDPKNPDEAYQKVKIDRQLLAIFKTCGVENIYTDDVGLSKRAVLCGLTPVLTASLEVPPGDQQMAIEFEPHEQLPQPDDASDAESNP